MIVMQIGKSGGQWQAETSPCVDPGGSATAISRLAGTESSRAVEFGFLRSFDILTTPSDVGG
ncbi:MAG: hypothetical protein OXE76_09625 [Alphaproteobacteria bacterium]|nr:hypothetical protein [Alphaproteobacteria bacterium]